MADDLLNSEINQLKKNIVSDDVELADSAAIKLRDIGGEEIVEFLIVKINLQIVT